MVASAVGALAWALATPAAAQTGGSATPQGGNATGIQPSGPGDVIQKATQQGSTPDIVVTGSLIKGTPEDAAAPVAVIGADELAKQGNPTPVELLKSLPRSSGVLGDFKQFDSRAQGAGGIASANLRGLGPSRTLVLLNSKRLATAASATARPT